MKTKFYLKENLPTASLKFKWNEEHNKKYFDFLYENYTYEYIHKQKNKAEIKQAFIDFFESVGYLIFQFKENKINFKLLAYNVLPQDSSHLQELIDIIVKHKDNITYNYKERENQIAIEYKPRRDIYRFIETIDDERVNKQELIKYAVRKALHLASKDLVLTKKRLIFIKLLSHTQRKEVDLSTESEQNRFNGYDEEELQELLDEYFDEQALASFLQAISKRVFYELFIEKKVTNKVYEKIIFPYVQSIIAKELLEFIDEDEEFAKGFAGYIFRVNFLDVFQHIAQELLKQIYLKNSYIISWLKYYNGQIFIDDEKRYIAQELISHDNNKWNPVAIHTNITTWFKTKERILMYKAKIVQIDEKLSTMMIEGMTPVEYKKMLQDDYQETKRVIDEINLELQESIDKKYVSKEASTKSKLNLHIKELREELKEYKKDMLEISDKLGKIKDFNKFKKIEEEKNRYLKDLKRETRVLTTNKEVYLSIESAVVKALISKRKAV